MEEADGVGEETLFDESLKKFMSRLDDGSEDRNKVLSNIGSLQEALEITDEQTHEYYTFARNLCKDKQFEKAQEVFVTLASLNPNVAEYWMGIGYCCKEQDLHEDAVLHYTIAKAVNSESPFPYYNLAESYLILNEYGKGEDSIDTCISLCTGKTEYSDLLERAKVLKQKFN